MKYLPVHLPEAEKGDPAQVIIESTSRGEKMTCKEIPWEKISCIEKKKLSTSCLWSITPSLAVFIFIRVFDDL